MENIDWTEHINDNVLIRRIPQLGTSEIKMHEMPELHWIRNSAALLSHKKNLRCTVPQLQSVEQHVLNEVHVVQSQLLLNPFIWPVNAFYRLLYTKCWLTTIDFKYSVS